MPKKNINIDDSKVYSFPKKLSIVNHQDKILVIADEVANWIVLDNKKQLEIFNLLNTSNSIETILKINRYSLTDIQNVLIQVEAKHFENTTIIKQTSSRVQIYLTNGCNLRCPHCYMYAGVKEEDELTLDELFVFLNTAKRFGVTDVTFTGGEISLRKDLYDIVKYAYDIGLKIQLLSNGTLWTQDLISKISPMISFLQISIDGYDEDSNSKVRGKGTFAKSLDTLDRFIHAGVTTEVAITPFYDENLKEDYIRYANFGLLLQKKYQNYNFKVHFTGEMLDGRDVHLSPQEHEEYTMIMNKIYSVCFDSNTSDYVFIRSRMNKEVIDNCAFGNISLSSTGNVYFCARIPSLNFFGNIREDSLEHIFRSSRIAKDLSNVKNIYPCCQCDLMYICGGDCRIKFFKEFTSGKLWDQNKVHPRRKCDYKTKSFYYDMLIRTNEMLYQ